MAGFFPGSTPAGAADVFFQMSADGAGNISALSVPGYIGGDGTAIQTQNISSFKYNFSNGAAVLNFPAPSSFLYFSGQEYLNMSPDGNFMFGGSPNGFDMIVGIRNPTAGTLQNFGNMYYQAGIDEDMSLYSTTSAFVNIGSYYGSLVNGGNGNLVAHERQLNTSQLAASLGALGYTYMDTYPSSITGTYNDTSASMQYAFGTNGTYRIGAGVYPFLGLNVAIQAPTFSGSASGPYLNPAGVTNSASSAPFTAGVSPGELITLYGTNLASQLVVSPVVPLPTTLGGVQVLFDGLPGAIYYVSPGQVSVLVPFAYPFSVVSIQLINNGVRSNTITVLLNENHAGGLHCDSRRTGLRRRALGGLFSGNAVAPGPAWRDGTCLPDGTGRGFSVRGGRSRRSGQFHAIQHHGHGKQYGSGSQRVLRVGYALRWLHSRRRVVRGSGANNARSLSGECHDSIDGSGRRCDADDRRTGFIRRAGPDFDWLDCIHVGPHRQSAVVRARSSRDQGGTGAAASERRRGYDRDSALQAESAVLPVGLTYNGARWS